MSFTASGVTDAGLLDAVAPLHVVVAALAVWLAVLTVIVVRRTGSRVEPVYRRLPSGRIRFTLNVARELGKVGRRMSVDVVGTRQPPRP